MTNNSNRRIPPKAIYHITESKKHDSLDPLDGDKTHNLPVQRMLYLTPLEVGPDDKLVSHILEDFSFDGEKNQIMFKVAAGRTFSDGSLITSGDVAAAIVRMLRRRPDFPVIRSISGKAEWLNSGATLDSLPAGVQVIDSTIRIQLDRFESNPLYRFCLELFSIVPKRCIDPKTNEISCEDIPTSGFYSVAKELSDGLLFQKRVPGKIYGLTVPESIEFRYSSLSVLEKPLPRGEVVAANEAKFSSEKLERIAKKHKVIKKPSSRFSVLLINKRSEKFSDNQLRFWFAERFREAYARRNGIDQVEASIFTKILPGYMSHGDLKSNGGWQQPPMASALAQLSELKWVENLHVGRNILREPLEAIYSELGLKIPPPVELKDGIGFEEAFLNGEVDLMYGSTGFWSLDPIGDIQMLFTPNMHETLEGVWSDQELQVLLSELSLADANNESFQRINRYIYRQAYFNVFGHLARLYIQTHSAHELPLPFGITSPPPWMLFANGYDD